VDAAAKKIGYRTRRGKFGKNRQDAFSHGISRTRLAGTAEKGMAAWLNPTSSNARLASQSRFYTEDRSAIAVDKPRGWMLAPVAWQKHGAQFAGGH